MGRPRKEGGVNCENGAKSPCATCWDLRMTCVHVVRVPTMQTFGISVLIGLCTGCTVRGRRN